jgi:hypothetical protein
MENLNLSKKSGNQYSNSTEQDATGAILMNWRKVPASKLLELSVEAEDFFNVLSKLKASVGPDEIIKCIAQRETEGVELARQLVYLNYSVS